MQDTALFNQLLGLNSPWKVAEGIPNLDDKSITIRIEWPKGEKEPCHALKGTRYTYQQHMIP